MRARTLGLVSTAVLTPVAAVLAGYTVWIVGQWLDEKAADAMIYPEPDEDDAPIFQVWPGTNTPVPSVNWSSLAEELRQAMRTALYGDEV